MSKILIIGGTGNMGRPLVKSLAEGGHNVSVVCRRKVGEEDIRRLASNGGGYYFGDAKDRKFMASVLTQHYDAIVDFCIYSSDEFRERMGTFLDMTDQYVCLSSAAVYADIPRRRMNRRQGTWKSILRKKERQNGTGIAMKSADGGSAVQLVQAQLDDCPSRNHHECQSCRLGTVVE